MLPGVVLRCVVRGPLLHDGTPCRVLAVEVGGPVVVPTGAC